MSRVPEFPRLWQLRPRLLGASCSGLAALLALVVMFTCSALLARAESATGAADVILTHGKVYTVNQAQPWAEAVAIKDGKIVAGGQVQRHA